METLKEILATWTLIGWIVALFIPVSKFSNKKQALKLTIILGPIFWVGVPLMGLLQKCNVELSK